jgi:hypothetical protein
MSKPIKVSSRLASAKPQINFQAEHKSFGRKGKLPPKCRVRVRTLRWGAKWTEQPPGWPTGLSQFIELHLDEEIVCTSEGEIVRIRERCEIVCIRAELLIPSPTLRELLEGGAIFLGWNDDRVFVPIAWARAKYPELEILDVLERKTKGQLLDIGCGDEQAALEAAERHAKALRAPATDGFRESPAPITLPADKNVSAGRPGSSIREYADNLRREWGLPPYGKRRSDERQ